MGLLCAVLLSIHLSRGDSRFVWHHLAQPQRKLFSEYLFFSLPFILAALPTWQFWEFFECILFCFCLAHWKVYRSQKRIYWKNLGKIIPAQDFEWLSGVRKHCLALSILFILIYSFCWVRALPIIGLWFVTLIFINFYTEGESLTVIRLFYKGNPAAFLWKKLKRSTVIFTMLYLPPLLLNLYFHPDIWFAYPVFFAMEWVVLAYSIFAKYSIYRPNQVLKGNTVIQSLALIGAIFPFLAPLPIFLCFWYYAKAKKHLALLR